MLLLDDVRAVTAAGLRDRLGFLPQVVVGSPPCQDFSGANVRGRGVDGDRGRLFFEACRLVGELRPRWFAFENSPRLRLRGSDRVLAELEAQGNAVWPVVVGAVHAGAPHRRQRVWVVGVRLDCLPVLEPANDNRAAPADAAQERRRAGRPGRSLATGPGEPVEPLREPGPVGPWAPADANVQPVRFQRQRVAGRWPGELRARGDSVAGYPGPGAAADSGQVGLSAGRLEKRAGLEGQAGAIAVGSGPDGCELGADPGADSDGARHAVDALGAEGDRGGPGAASVGVAWLDAWASWGRGCAGSLRMADGLPSGLARQCIAAYGDAVLPQLVELIGRTMGELVPTDGTVLDLFAGAAGGWSLGLHRAGFRTVAAVELDPWRRATFGRLHGGAA